MPPELLQPLSLIHISEPTRLLSISYAVFCLKKKNECRFEGDVRLHLGRCAVDDANRAEHEVRVFRQFTLVSLSLLAGAFLVVFGRTQQAVLRGVVSTRLCALERVE